VYDETHNDYTYTKAYVSHLADQLATEDGYNKIVGHAPALKAARKTS
jgi:hypothetical protein